MPQSHQDVTATRAASQGPDQRPETGPETVHWFPGRLFQTPARGARGARGATDANANAFALIILNQPLRDLPRLKTLWENSCLRVAADGGANQLLAARDQDPSGPSFDDLDAIIGDLDSLTAQARHHFTSTATPAKVIHDPDQNSTDFGKAVRWTRASLAPIPNQDEHEHEGEGEDEASGRAVAPDIVAMGGLGGRVDQGLSQLHHLYLLQRSPTYAEGRLFLVSSGSVTFVLKPGKHRVHLRGGARAEARAEGHDMFDKYVGVVPVGGPSVITLRGFEWDVTAWETAIGAQVSTSNHVLPQSDAVDVETSGDVLFTIALKR